MLLKSFWLITDIRPGQTLKYVFARSFNRIDDFMNEHEQITLRTQIKHMQQLSVVWFTKKWLYEPVLLVNQGIQQVKCSLIHE